MTAHIAVTDGWHPTVNPSARMPVHHLRFVATLGHHDGVLNEFPRRRGGSTLRLVRLTDHHLRVLNLPGTLEWVTWWLPASDARAAGAVAGIYQRALRHEACAKAEREVFDRTLTLFETARARYGAAATVGEALTTVMDELTRGLIPTVPRLRLVSLTRSPLRSTLARSLAEVPGGLADALGRWADLSGDPMWPLAAVATDQHGEAQRVRFHAVRRLFDTTPLLPSVRHGRPCNLSADELVGLLDQGRLLPGARLVAMAEANLARQGAVVRHYGNTYGHTAMAGRALGVPSAATIPCHPDDADSWHYAVIQAPTSSDRFAYPLHLLDVLACTPEARAAVVDLVAESIRRNKPVNLQPKESLDATLLAGRARLLGKEDGGP